MRARQFSQAALLSKGSSGLPQDAQWSGYIRFRRFFEIAAIFMM